MSYWILVIDQILLKCIYTNPLGRKSKILFRVPLLISFVFFLVGWFSLFLYFFVVVVLSLAPMELTDFLQNKILMYQIVVNVKQVCICINIIYTSVKYGDSRGERKMQEKKKIPNSCVETQVLLFSCVFPVTQKS